jgi:hypothetical protein
MTRHRSSSIFLTLSLTLAAMLAVAPGSAMAGSLLSGYGGPGSGSQALLGSTLINGTPPTSGGGSSSSGSGATTTLGTQPPGGRSGAGQGAGTGAAAHANGGSGAQDNGARGTAGASGASAGGSSTYTSPGSTRPATGLAAAAQDTGLLGITGADVLLLVLVLSVLAVTAGLTVRLAGTQH